jgi:hypothetical protein
MPMFVSNLYDASAAVSCGTTLEANDLRKQSRVVNNNGQEQARFNRRALGKGQFEMIRDSGGDDDLRAVR